jgi:NitT/TauT family transport system ATP-binding protein
MIRIETVSHDFGEDEDRVSALADISLTIGDAEFVAVVGPSGCGKSTLLRLIAGLIRPTSGRILLGEKLITAPTSDVGLVFQSPTLLPWANVLDNVLFPLRMLKELSAKNIERARELLDLAGLAGFEQRMPDELSGGMQQRVALAATLILGPRILLMDEPFGALDPGIRLRMQELLMELWKEQEATVFLVTHSVEEAVYLGDRVFLMAAKPGRLIEILKVPRPSEPPEESRRKPWFINFCQTLLRRLEEESPAPPMTKI